MTNVIKLAAKQPRARLERDVVTQIRNAAARLPWCVLWRNNTGVLKDQRGIPVTFGLCPGSADLVGIVGPFGRFVAIEVKQPGKKPTDVQLKFLDVARSFGSAATWVDNADDAIAFLERVRMGVE